MGDVEGEVEAATAVGETVTAEEFVEDLWGIAIAAVMLAEWSRKYMGVCRELCRADGDESGRQISRAKCRE